ncbi:TGF-beta-activated kinase 1 and MAP3K7-binding protein 1-like [Diadema antillarum]|uniref:TGF-beta-activated kinase 1 and MAP3K7-binding protein 1-like n=1 Tax=Diadema antillarum TaxID=105358 RepID=UPI003A83844E
MTSSSRTPRRNTPSLGSSHSQSSLHSTSWTDDLPVCRHSGIGYSNNQIYRADGGRNEDHEFEDKFFHFKTEQNDYLYAIFDGYDGVHVANFAHQRLPAELLLGQLLDVQDDAEVKRILQQSFETVERCYFEQLDHILAERTNLKLSLPDGLTDYELYQKFPGEMDKLQSMEEELSGGTSSIVTLIHGDKLYVANVGDSHALLCTLEPDGTTKVRQLSVDHTVLNQDELLRLSQLGVDTTVIQTCKLFGDKNATRTIGNYMVKGGFRDMQVFRDAKSEPIIAEPDIIGGLDMRHMTGFLMMYSNGLSHSLIEATGTTQANLDLAYIAMAEFEVQATLSGVAQAVVDKVVRRHHDAYLSGGERVAMCQKREDITLIVRNFNYPIGSRISSPTSTTPFNQVSLPFSPLLPSGSQPPRLTISTAGVNPVPADTQTSIPITTPLYIQVDNGTSDPQRSPFGAIRGDLTPQPSNHQSYFNQDDPHTTPRPSPYQTASSQDEEMAEDENTEDTRSGSTTSNTCSSNGEPQRVFDFNRHDENKAEPDEDGLIDPYVDFTDFFIAYKAVCPDAVTS